MSVHRRSAVGGGLVMAFLAGLVLSASAGAQDKVKDLDKIPKAVKDTLNAKFPKHEIRKWTKEKEGGDVIYDIEFTVKGRKWEADIKEDGSIMNYEKEVAVKDLPAAVVKTVEQKYPKAKLKEIMEITEMKGKQAKLEGYEIVLQTAANKEVEITVAPDGKILEEDSGEAKKDEK
ncbi:MAG: PepSY-like domain-containing protein [Gemmataceae bacterium]|nr:PepSY-like domain-containing protein [Gemmataceae bacterium]